MCEKVVEDVKAGNEQVLADVRRIVGNDKYLPSDAKDLCSKIFYTCYMGTTNSSEATKKRYVIL